jgi:small subunit ribosomal protein S6
MRRYETIIITDPDLSAEEREPVLQRVTDVVNQGDGYLALTDEWGARKLAYEIKKKDRGYYLRFDFCGTGAVVNEMERFFRIDDRVLKYMTVLLDETADIEKIKEEIAETQSKAEVAKKKAEAAETKPPDAQAATAVAQTPSKKPPETQTETAEAQTPSEKPPEAQAEAAVAQTPSEKPPETQTETAEAQTPSEKPPEAQAEAAVAQTPSEKPPETDEAQTPEPEVGESEATPTEIEEEKK